MQYNGSEIFFDDASKSLTRVSVKGYLQDMRGPYVCPNGLTAISPHAD